MIQLTENFLAPYRSGLIPAPFGPVGAVTYYRTYSRPDKTVRHEDGEVTEIKNQMEHWVDTCKRVIEGNFNLLENDPTATQEKAERAFELMYKMAWLPPGRGLWMSGTKYQKERGGDALNNCFRGDTRVFIKDLGLVAISELEGEHEVLSDGGVYRKAEFRSYGKQKLMKITFNDGQEVYATPEHQWIVLAGNSGERQKERIFTKDLRPGHKIPVIRSKAPTQIDEKGIAHGFVFGDGTRIPSGYCRVSFFKNDMDLFDIVAKFGDVMKTTVPTITNLPFHFKKLPNIAEYTPEYLLGFLLGYIAADGHVRGTQTRLHCKDEVVLEAIREIAQYLGLKVNPVVLERTDNPYNGEKAPLYSISFSAETFPGHLLPRLDQRDYFAQAKRVAKVPYKEIKSVEETNLVEEVFCCNEPETHSFVIEGNLLTGNCWFVAVRPQSYQDLKMYRNHPYIFSDREKPMASFPFVFTFDRAMTGGGVGFSIEKKNIDQMPMVDTQVDMKIYLSPNHADWEYIKNSGDYEKIKPFLTNDLSEIEGYVVHRTLDSRQGWGMSYRELIDSHFSGQKNAKLVFDMSDVRGYGSEIKGFGGTASGPLPLMVLFTDVNNILNKRVGKHINSVDALDIMNMTGRCVVAGNVRRTALIALGSNNDQEYVDAKNYTLVFPIMKKDENGYVVWENNKQVRRDYDEVVAELGQERADELYYTAWAQENHRWASNNSVMTNENFTDFGFIAAGIIANGEPGVINEYLMKNFGRIADGFQENIDADAEGMNPCAK